MTGTAINQRDTGMDHKEQRHEHHRKEREARIAHEQERERQEGNLPRKIHPLWFVIVGAVLVILALAAWNLFFI